MRISFFALLIVSVAFSGNLRAESIMEEIAQKNEAWLQSCLIQCSSDEQQSQNSDDIFLTNDVLIKLQRIAVSVATKDCEQEYRKKIAQAYGGNELAKSQRRARLGNELAACKESYALSYYENLIAETKQEREQGLYDQVESCKESCEKAAQRKTSD